MNNSNTINWFEIPVLDMQRAKTFYNTIFNIELQETEFSESHFAYFTGPEVNGALAKGPG